MKSAFCPIEKSLLRLGGRGGRRSRDLLLDVLEAVPEPDIADAEQDDRQHEGRHAQRGEERGLQGVGEPDT